ncbi:facilitated trehalose transporter Tret1-like [Cylas formicarius]|uniref:facilitated trehalose transporter Tret1-like n=1 Tax=Cylas formicarius TaxID=197179 RepID=UPI002958B3FA|nr:facilitated trehalose transporter Tret1-like [Cylas formicarius]
MDETVGKRRSAKTVSLQVTLAFLTNFSNVAPGMSIGFSSVTIPALKDFDSQQISWFASIASLATPFGCLLAGPIADKYGRKRAIAVVNVTAFLGWATVGAAFYSGNYLYPVLLLGRVLTGLSTGLCGCPAAIYMAEVATSDLRSVFTTWVSLFYAVGIFTVYLLGLFLKDDWGLIALIAAIFPLISFLFLTFWVPESPSWLISKNRVEEAKRSVCKLHSSKSYTEDVHTEIESLIKVAGTKVTRAQTKTPTQQFVKKIKLLARKSFLRPFALVLVYFAVQQFSGVFVIMFYAIDIVKAAQVTIDPYVAIVIIATVRLVSMLMLSYFSKKFGVRPLSLISGSGMTVCMVVLGSYILLVEQGRIAGSLQQALGIMPLILLNAYFFVSTMGFYPLPFAITAEVFPRNLRGTAAGLSVACNYVFNFITVKLYPTMLKSFGSHGVFFFYGAVALLGTVFVWFFLPETKGKTLEEIQEYFVDRKPMVRETTDSAVNDTKANVEP